MNNLHTSADLKQYSKRCLYVFVAVVCGTLAMVAASFAPLNHPGLRIALVLLVAGVNATMVATFLMHLVSEKRFILVVLAFTVIFFLALLGLTVVAAHDIPAVVRS
jgi:hypothetical protein